MRVIAVDGAWLTLAGLKNAIQKTMPPGATLQDFRHPADALQYARAHPVDVAFITMELPQMHGLILAKKLQQLNPRVNLIFIAENSDYAFDAWKLHASGYLGKPFRQEKFAQAFAHLRYAPAGHSAPRHLPDRETQ